MGTVAGVNTRRYHGLLIASLHPPADRYSVFPRVEETVAVNGKKFELATVQYPGAVSPSGYQLMEEFSTVPFPTWTYRCDQMSIEKTVRLIEGEQTAVISYRASGACKLTIRLFISFRDYHGLTQENQSLNTKVLDEAGQIQIKPYEDLPTLTIHHKGTFEADGKWFVNHEYLRELDRGLDFREDLYSPGNIHFDLAGDETIELIASLETGERSVQAQPRRSDDTLVRSLNHFRVLRADGRPTLIAGYPWFTDWSRDTLISLPAYVASGFDPAETRSILEFLLAERDQGILPNRFSDKQSGPEYNTVDASLWFFIAAAAYVRATNDYKFLRDVLYPSALDIIQWHQHGTFFSIHVDPSDHLLWAGEEGTQLTWMDAKVGDSVVTPRLGKPVEINALWFNALKITSDWAAILGDSKTVGELNGEAELVQDSFVKKFWNAERKCLYDVLTLAGPDVSFRPNQIFAISLPYPLLDREQAKDVVQSVQKLLVTPVGLRTLEPSDPHYVPHFIGDMRARDAAYHQGTVWPWLMGPFIEAYLYAYKDELRVKQECEKLVKSMLGLMSDGCLGSIAEVFDGDEPHSSGGCPAQLWSVAQTALAFQRLRN